MHLFVGLLKKDNEIKGGCVRPYFNQIKNELGVNNEYDIEIYSFYFKELPNSLTIPKFAITEEFLKFFNNNYSEKITTIKRGGK